MRDERNRTAASIVGRQAPLGADGRHPAELRTETSRNNGVPAMRSQVVGNVNVERVNLVDAEGNSELVEGRDDTAQQIPAP